MRRTVRYGISLRAIYCLDDKAGLQLDGTPITLHAPDSRRDLREDIVAMKVLDDGTAEFTITRRHYGNAHAAFVQE